MNCLSSVQCLWSWISASCLGSHPVKCRSSVKVWLRRGRRSPQGLSSLRGWCRTCDEGVSVLEVIQWGITYDITRRSVTVFGTRRKKCTPWFLSHAWCARSVREVRDKMTVQQLCIRKTCARLVYWLQSEIPITAMDFCSSDHWIRWWLVDVSDNKRNHVKQLERRCCQSNQRASLRWPRRQFFQRTCMKSVNLGVEECVLCDEKTVMQLLTFTVESLQIVKDTDQTSEEFREANEDRHASLHSRKKHQIFLCEISAEIDNHDPSKVGEQKTRRAWRDSRRETPDLSPRTSLGLFAHASSASVSTASTSLSGVTLGLTSLLGERRSRAVRQSRERGTWTWWEHEQVPLIPLVPETQEPVLRQRVRPWEVGGQHLTARSVADLPSLISSEQRSSQCAFPQRCRRAWARACAWACPKRLRRLRHCAHGDRVAQGADVPDFSVLQRCQRRKLSAAEADRREARLRRGQRTQSSASETKDAQTQRVREL